MAAFSFRYEFSKSEKDLWIPLLDKGFKGVKGTVTLSPNEDTKKIKFGHKNDFRDFLESATKYDKVTVIFEKIWDQLLFWNSLPSIDGWTRQKISTPKSNELDRCNKTVKDILEFVDREPTTQEFLDKQFDFSFDHIKWILLKVHESVPIRKIYLSPKTKIVHIMFENHGIYIIINNRITNGIGLVFDYDDGFTKDVFGNDCWTNELLEDYNKWKKDKTKKLFHLH